ncbi:phosphorylase b kinase regulatory subunit beta [Strongylocentrotus purpuratus]|uniref:Phosphorylase b kinase regulatory subunit n=1 Tax=Strongylocentrotus purpuratus TaxID=7668 RepID=A0A7M7N7B5_STRPU|nr:phosphorylase b kinase regulatory subunit beta [Strongylocentrotus purpuratus]
MAPEADDDYLKQIKSLNYYYCLVKEQILIHQSPALGVFPVNTDVKVKEAGVRESVYSAVAVWALALAYRKVDDDDGRTYELEQSAVKCMRGLLYCFMRQADRVDKFKNVQSEEFALHSRYDLNTGNTQPDNYHHLQIDSISLYLLYLVQMISSGLQIIYTLDEVSFVQNLVYYVERAYRTPDFGVWERGSKYNTGKKELHASSIGMAKAALEASNGFNLFGKEGTSWSILYVDPDAHARNRTTLESLLPRESSSKNTDAALIATVSFPAFALDDECLAEVTLDKIKRKLRGKHGFKRFLRDGYGTVLEDKNRKYYKPTEVKLYDMIESEWPLFFIFMMLDGLAKNKTDQVDEYYNLLKPLLKQTKYGMIVPKYYYIPKGSIEGEKHQPGSQLRIASTEGEGNNVFLWGQSMYILSCLLKDGLVKMSELDPEGRYLGSSLCKRYRHNTRHSAFEMITKDMTVQMVFIAESTRLQTTLATYGIQSQTPTQIEPIEIWSPSELIKALAFLGQNKKLGLTGRPNRPIGIIGTSKIYRLLGRTVICYPLQFDLMDFYMYQDINFLVDDIKSLVAFVRKSWNYAGRPTLCLVIREEHFMGSEGNAMLEMLASFKRGSCNGIRVKVDRLQTLIASSSLEHLDFQMPEGSAANMLFKPLEELNVDHLPFKALKKAASYTSLVQKEEVPLNIKELETRSTWEVVQELESRSMLQNQAEILGVLLEREGLNFVFDGASVDERMSILYQKARILKDWSTVRYCASIMRKVVDSLAPSVTSMLANGKFITVGVFGHEEELISRPINPSEIKTIIFERCQRYSVREAVMQQEMIIALGKLISTRKDLFRSVLKIRVGWLLHAMKSELEITWKETVPIHSLCPSRLKDLMCHVLEIKMTTLTDRTWLQRRQFSGALNRTPVRFYDKVWNILGRTPSGLSIANYYLPQQPTLSDMTQTDLNFALRIEEMFGRISHPEYRQLMVELLSVVATILERNRELQFQHTVNMDAYIHEAFGMYREDNMKGSNHDPDDLTPFYNLPLSGKTSTSNYLARVVTSHLLDSSPAVGAACDESCSVS